MIGRLAIKSLRNRKLTASLTAVSIALSVMLLLGVERIRQESRESFASTVSGTDLIVGARSSPVHLLLFSVLRIGNATNNLRWESYEALTRRPEVAWAIPIALGDSHRGYRVLGTTPAYFEHFRYSRGRALEFAQGTRFAEARDAVLGADVAEALGYRVGQSIVIAHGAGDVSFSLHEEQPFRVAGVLARTGTPVDRTVHVPLEGLDDVHAPQADAGVADPLAAALQQRAREHARTPSRTVTAVLVGLKLRGAALSMQRWVNEFPDEPLTAILPGATLQEVWEIVGVAERALFAVSVLVVAVGLAGMLVALLTSLSERRREMAILRSVGARPAQVFALLLGEAAFLTLVGIALGVLALYVGLIIAQSWLTARFGLHLAMGWPSAYEAGLILLIAAAGVLIGLVPAYRIYRYSLADGMTVRI
jgi:putative ABC transport system permease protein